jgi:hypothetical protein
MERKGIVLWNLLVLLCQLLLRYLKLWTQECYKADSDSQPPKDAEGFSVPSSSIDPIQQAINEAAQYVAHFVASKLYRLTIDRANEAAAQFKVDIKNAPIEEEHGDASAAMADVANALQAVRTSLILRDILLILIIVTASNTGKSSNYPRPEK